MTTEIKDIGEHLGVTPAHRWKRLAGWLVTLLVIGAGGFALLKKVQASQVEPPVAYRTQPARQGDLTVTVRATGQLQPTKSVDVGSEVSGIIDSVEVDYNDHVKVGQVLAKINIDKFQSTVLQSKASLDSARAKVQDAQVTVQETEKKYRRIVEARARSNNQLPSKQDLETAQANYERAKVAVSTAQATVTQAEATLAVDQTNLSKTVIKSPVNGVVLARNVEPGQTIAASFSVTTMFALAEDLSNMKLQVNIDEADVGEVKAGQPAAFTVDAYPGKRFPGKITQLRYQSTTTNNVVTYLAVISVNNKEMLLRPGMTATAEITVLSVPNALLAPNVALRFKPTATSGQDGDQRSWFRKLMPGPPAMATKVVEAEDTGGPRVWVLRDQKPVAVPVKTGATNGKVTEIVSGGIAAGVPLVIDTMKGAK
jgi:HlyD family secretion protein